MGDSPGPGGWHNSIDLMVTSSEDDSLSGRTIRWAGVAGVIGGALFVVSAALVLRRRDGPATRACKVKGGTRSTSAVRSRVLAAMLGSALGIALTPLLSYRWATCSGAYLHYGRAYFLVYTGCSMGLAGL